MDVSRAVLDNLMGRDRNKPNDKITERDHYSNPDVFLGCKTGLQIISGLFLLQYFVPQHYLRRRSL